MRLVISTATLAAKLILAVAQLVAGDVPPQAPPVMPPVAPPVDPSLERSRDCCCEPTCDCHELGSPCTCTKAPREAHNPVAKKQPPLVATVADRGCAPCIAFEEFCLPMLDEAGWIEGRDYLIRRVPFGSETVPNFTYHGRRFSTNGYGGKDEWLRSLKAAMRTLESPAVAFPDRHSHRCDGCGTVWWHSHAEPQSISHNCPRCGRQQTIVHSFADH